MRLFAFCCFFLLFAPLVSAQTKIVKQWDFNTNGQKEGWEGANCLADVEVRDGAYRAVCSGPDPFLSAYGLETPVGPSRILEVRYKTDKPGKGELFFSNTNEGLYGGFTQEKAVHWPILGDGLWHTARVFPHWAGEGKVVQLRIDWPNLNEPDYGKVHLEIDWIRIVDLDAATTAIQTNWDFSRPQSDWRPIEDSRVETGAAGLKIISPSDRPGGVETEGVVFDSAQAGNWIALEMSVDRGKKGTLEFLSDAGRLGSFSIPLLADARSHWYNFKTSGNPNWTGKVYWLRLTPSEETGATAVLKRVVIADAPQGPPEVVVERVFLSEAINQSGIARPLAIRLRNNGGRPAQGLKIRELRLPKGVRVVSPDGWQSLPELAPLENRTVSIELFADAAVEGTCELQLFGDGVPELPASGTLRFEPSLNLPKADYVPQPKPLRSDYEIGAYYFPGWNKPAAWERISSTHPERKPVLGWYDEGNPEVVDWQIKWSLENGIQYYLVDWYWNRGEQYLEHWIKAFQKAKYKSMFRWAVMWANHNGKGSHSEEDQRKVTRYWIDNYFNTPEYYTIDGQPVVVIWSPSGMDEDIREAEAAKGIVLKKGDGVKRLLDISRSMAHEAGHKGIYFVAMKWPEGSTLPEDVRWLQEAGFDMTSIYHYMDHGGKAENPMRFPFQQVVDSSLPYWEKRYETDILPFLPNLSTGWDSRPWHGDENIIIENRTVVGFRKICEDLKTFCEKTKIRRIVLAPTNEWGEGSYVEPNAEFGFGMFETVREVFCEKPEGGWPLNFAPSDVGLGPYDYPSEERSGP